MAFNSEEWFIHYATKKIGNQDSSVGASLPATKGSDASVGTVLEFFQWCASTFAEAEQMDDDYAFVSDTPTVYRFVNDWGFYADASDWKYLSGGSIESADSSLLWSNLYSIGSQETGTQLYMIQGVGNGATDEEVTPWWITGNVDILVEVKRDGQFIYSLNSADVSTAGGIWMFAREFGELYDHNFATLSGGGSTPIGINTAADSGNLSGEVSINVSSVTSTAVGEFILGGTTGAVGKVTSISGDDIVMSAIRGGQYTGTEALTVYTDRELQNATGATPTLVQDNSVVAGYTDISINFYPGEKDLINGQGDQWYDCSIWVPPAYTMAQMYQFLKYVTRYTSVDQFYQLNADDGQEYRSAAETDGGGATAQGPYTDVKVAPFGTLAGTTFFGARGIWVNGGTTADFVLLDSDGVSQSPPNYQKVTVTHDNLVGVQIFVAEITSAGGTIIKDQYAVDASTASTLTVDPAIDSNKTPENGKFRIGDLQYVYTSFSGTVFSGITPEPSAPVDSSVYVPFLDVLADTNPEISANVIYGGDVDVRTVVRKYGFKPYTADTTFGSTGLSFSPILTTDPQAT